MAAETMAHSHIMPETIMAQIERTAREYPDRIPAEVAGQIAERMLREGQARWDAARDTPIEVPTVPDRFEGVVGLPEISRADLDGETLASAITHHGALLVRGLYSERELQRLRETPEAGFDVGATNNDRSMAEKLLTQSTLLEMLRIYEECGLLGAIRGYFGESPILWPVRVRLRRFTPSQNRRGLPWHQDVNFFGRQCYAVNCWAAVSHCGERNPGLSILPLRTEERYGWSDESRTAPLMYGRNLPAETITRLSETHPPVEPIFEPGDAVLFDEMTLHRTSDRPFRMEQLVTVTWFFRPGGFPPFGQAPIAL